MTKTSPESSDVLGKEANGKVDGGAKGQVASQL